MKILVLQSELGVLLGGGENFTRNLFSILAGRGHEISAAFVAAPSGSYPLPLPAGISAIPLPGWWRRKPGQEAISFLSRFLPTGSRPAAAVVRIKESMDWRGAQWHDQRFQRRVLRDLAPVWNQFDAIYVHGNLQLASEMARHRPTILRLPGPATAEQEPLLRTIPAVCANGDALARLRSFMGDDVLELPVGVDCKRFAPGNSSIRGSLGWTENHRVIGYVGRLAQLKGVDLLAEAFLQVISTHPEVRLILIGHGEEEARLRYLLAKEIALGAVQIIPGISSSELPPWYRAMDVFVLPSRYENFSNALLEAAACGIPFIASDVGGNRTLQQRGSGVLFERASSSDLGRKLGEFLSDANARRASARTFSAVVEKEYSWDACADRLEWILQSRLEIKPVRLTVQQRECRTGYPEKQLRAIR